MAVPVLCFPHRPPQSTAKQPGLHCNHCSCDGFQMLRTHRFGAWPRSQPSFPDKPPLPVLYYIAGPSIQPQADTFKLLSQGTQAAFLALTVNFLCGLRRLLAFSEPYFLGYSPGTNGSISKRGLWLAAAPQGRIEDEDSGTPGLGPALLLCFSSAAQA